MLSLHVVVTLSALPSSLADVEEFLLEARRLGARDSDTVLGGGHLAADGFPVPSGGLVRAAGSDTLASLAAWVGAVRAAGLDPAARVTGSLALDVPVRSVRTSNDPSCGVHVELGP